jgi:hypothetical protein
LNGWQDGLCVELRSLQESIDTTSSGGHLVFHLFVGHWPSLNVTWCGNVHKQDYRLPAGAGVGEDDQRCSVRKKALALKLHQERNHTIEEICNMMGISKSTLPYITI